MKNNYEEWWYNKIFREFSKPQTKTQKMFWLCKTLKKLMILLEITKDVDLVKNSLVIVLNLIDDVPLDNFERVGKDIKNLPLYEREKIKRILKKTLLIERIEEH